MPRRSVLLFAGLVLVAAAVLAITTLVVVGGRDNATTGSQTVSSTGQPSVGGPFNLVDQALLDGKWTLVFFGFTWCPDYCPTTLAALKATQDRLGDRADDLQIVFISVDPERDRPQVLKDYLSSDGFPEGVIGLTGSPAGIRAAADAYRAYYQKVGEGEGYTMDHSLTVYLMGPDGQFRSALAGDLGPDRSADVIRRAMDRG